MLQAFFDDSGTHADSEMAVWGGIAGTVDQMEGLEAAWAAFLAEPLPGKPPLKNFHLSHCVAPSGEFRDYRPAERDRVRFITRKIIADSGVGCVAYTVPIKLYKRILKGRPLRAFGPPDGLAFASCIDVALQISQKHGNEPLACVLDKGQEDEITTLFVKDAERRAKALGVPITYTFDEVARRPGLQAADTIATEHYWYSLECIKAHPPKITPHFQSLINMTSSDNWVLLEPELRKMRQDYLKMYPTKWWLRGRRDD